MSTQTNAAIAADLNTIPFPPVSSPDAVASPAASTAAEGTADNVIVFNKSHRSLTVCERMNELRDEAQQWEQTAYRTANEKLYEILARCYAYERTFDRQEMDKLNEYCRHHNVAFNDNTQLMAKIVKCVFSVDRRRVSTYVLALRSAKQHGVKPDQLAAWLKQQGGVQEVSLKRNPNYKTTKERAEIARSTVFTQPVLATVSGENLIRAFNSELGPEVLLVATRNADNTFSIHRLIQKSGAMNAALSSVFTAVSTEAKAANVSVDAKSAAEQREAAMGELLDILRKQ